MLLFMALWNVILRILNDQDRMNSFFMKKEYLMDYTPETKVNPVDFAEFFSAAKKPKNSFFDLNKTELTFSPEIPA